MEYRNLGHSGLKVSVLGWERTILAGGSTNNIRRRSSTTPSNLASISLTLRTCMTGGGRRNTPVKRSRGGEQRFFLYVHQVRSSLLPIIHRNAQSSGHYQITHCLIICPIGWHRRGRQYNVASSEVRNRTIR